MNRSRITLYDFVPYGAPELLEAGEAHLTRALTTATAGLVAAFALTLCVSTWIAQHPGERTLEIAPGVLLMPPPALVKMAPAPQLPAVRHVAPPAAGVIVPVVDELAAPEQLIPSQDELRQGAQPDALAGPAGGVVLPPQPEAPPGIDDYVYFDEPPVVITRVVPVYPEIAREAGVDGMVLLRVLLGRDGRVRDVRVDRSVLMLDGAAIAAVRQWVFTPALSNKQPVMVWVAVPVRFSLH